jgi:hypothetical protein
MDVPVTGRAGVLSENCVDAFGGIDHLFRVAGGALHFGNLRRMREIFDGGVAVGAAKSSMYACGLLVRTDGNTLAFFGFHVRLAVTGEAGLALLERLSRFFQLARERGIRKKCQEQ